MSVYTAINAVQSELCKVGISKDRTNTQGSGYKFRGIDDVYNVLSPLLAANGLCILPRMISRHCDERQSKSGGALFYITVEAEFDFVCAEDGSKHTVKTFGEAMDSGDKATNKAMSAAYKYAAFQAFAIPTEGDNDADAQTHVVDLKESAKSIPVAVWESLSAGDQAALSDIAMEAIAIYTEQGAAETLAWLHKQDLNTDEKVALFSRFDPKMRAALKKPQSIAA